MRNAVYAAILLHFARKAIRKVSESKEDWTKSQVASMEENGIKIYRDIYADPSKCLVGYKGYSDMPYKVTYTRRRIFTGTEPEINIDINSRPQDTARCR